MSWATEKTDSGILTNLFSVICVTLIQQMNKLSHNIQRWILGMHYKQMHTSQHSKSSDSKAVITLHSLGVY